MRPTSFLSRLTDAALMALILAAYLLVSSLDAPEFDAEPAPVTTTSGVAK